jgi:DeoR family myo-inositol catabolism operon transcriptional repressor
MVLERRKEITQYIQARELVSLDELCDVFKKSKNTIRRDINDLESQGVLQKIYGGVRVIELPVSTGEIVSFTDRTVKNVNEKNRIGELAARLASDGDIIFIDSGTTVINTIDYLAAKKNLTILTNNFHVLLKCLQYPGINTVSFGGQLNTVTASFMSNFFFSDHLQMFNINKAFLSATGVSIESGTSNTSPFEAEIKKGIVQKSNMNILLVDHTKFDHNALLTYSSLNSFQYVVSDCAPSQKYLDYFAENDIQLILE